MSSALSRMIEKVNELNLAIENTNSAEVERFLNDPDVDVNFCYGKTALPLQKLFATNSCRITELFLECSRIDWLAPSWNRNMLRMEEVYGIQFDHKPTKNKISNSLTNSCTDYFYVLSRQFYCFNSELGAMIYEKIIEEIEHESKGENISQLLFKTGDRLEAFNAMLKHCPDINVRNEKGKSVLHVSRNIEIIKILLKMGANANAVDNNGITPLMDQADSIFADPSFDICQVLLENGADLAYVAPNGDSAFKCVFCSSIHFSSLEVPESAFHSFLQSESTMHSTVMDLIFEKNPKCKTIFESNLPLNLSSVENVHESEYLKDFDDASYLILIKNALKKKFSDELSVGKLIKAKHLAKTHAKELFEFACGARRSELVWHTESLIEDRTPLSVINCTDSNFLLVLNSNPLFTCNGFKFYELNESFKQEKLIDSFVLFALRKKGFDLFAPGEKTGKSLIDTLHPDAHVQFKYEHCSFRIPAIGITKEFFEVMSKNEIDAFAPIDSEGNTPLHYSASFSKLNFSIPSTSELKRVSNRAGKTPYDLIPENSNFYMFAPHLNDYQDICEFFENCITAHGPEIFKNYGGIMLSSAFSSSPNYALITYLMSEKSVSLNRTLSCGRTVFQVISRVYSLSQDLIIFLLPLVKDDYWELFKIIIREKMERALEALFNLPNDLIPLVHSLVENIRQLELNDTLAYFVGLLGIRMGLDILHQNYFRLCQNEGVIEFMQKTHIDARSLLSTSLSPILPLNDMRRRGNTWGHLSHIGWTIGDFKRLSIYNQLSKFRYFCSYFPNDIEFLSICFKDANISNAIGETNSCLICRCNFECEDSIVFLKCKHIFHDDCISEAVSIRDECPYCRTPNVKRRKQIY